LARYFVARLVEALLLILGVLILVFFMVRLTGDPVSLMISREATAEQRAAFTEAMGLNQPIGVQLAQYLGGVLQGDLGRSLTRGTPNLQLITERLPATLELALSSLFFSVAIAVPLGVAAGLRPGSRWDNLARVVGLAGQTVPSFVLAVFLILVFAVTLRWLPSFGRGTTAALILPTIALSFGTVGQLTLLTRAVIAEVRAENYVRTAHAKGLSPRQVAQRHVLQNAAIPLISVMGVQFTYLLGGSVYIESIFAWPGLGSLLETAISDSDFPLVQAITIFIALFAVSVNLITNLLYGWLDPRLRFA
jgi:peptide/nickel transport system permease protein